MIKLYKSLKEAEAKDDSFTKFVIIHAECNNYLAQIIFKDHMFWELEDGRVPRNKR